MSSKLNKKFFSDFQRTLNERKESAGGAGDTVAYAYFSGALEIINQIIIEMNLQESGELSC